MKLFIICAVLIFSISSNTVKVNSLAFSHPSSVFAVEDNPCDAIRNGEIICKDCQTIALCVQKESGWETLTLGTCSGTLYCDVEAQGCTYQNECALKSTAAKFQCQQSGTFPDPYDCRQYHVCNGQNLDDPKVCPNGLAYSPATKSCSLTTFSDTCVTPQFDCPQLGFMAPWPLDENIYYVCLLTQGADGKSIRYPVMHRCPDGQIFKKNRCIVSSSNNSPTSPQKPNTCSVADNSLLANSNDCYSYFICLKGQLIAKQCPTGSYFDSSSTSCQIGKC